MSHEYNAFSVSFFFFICALQKKETLSPFLFKLEFLSSVFNSVQSHLEGRRLKLSATIFVQGRIKFAFFLTFLRRCSREKELERDLMKLALNKYASRDYPVRN